MMELFRRRSSSILTAANIKEPRGFEPRVLPRIIRWLGFKMIRSPSSVEIAIIR
jgi:hypothetical protein